MLEKITPAQRHLVLVLLPAVLLAVLTVLKAITDANGVLTAVDWPTALWAAVAGVAAWLTAFLTPLTYQYGASSRVVPGEVLDVRDAPTWEPRQK